LQRSVLIPVLFLR